MVEDVEEDVPDMIDVVNPELSLVEVADAAPEAFSKEGVDEGVGERIVADPLVEVVNEGSPGMIDVRGFGLMADFAVDEAISDADSAPLLKLSLCCGRKFSAARLGS